MEQSRISGVVLAGGQARRMGQQDKGLIKFKQRPLVAYALEALAGITDQVSISANRNLAEYGQFGYPVIADGRDGFEGPLAGILAAMQNNSAETLLVLPCDSPLIKTAHLQRLLLRLKADKEIAVAFDGERLHPVVMALKIHLQTSLADYLAGGERKLQRWLCQHALVEVDFSDQPQVFANINTLDDLALLEGYVEG
jgi:molybdopterin-guanine dinucleotide biosynthesis protein A, proteobacterial